MLQDRISDRASGPTGGNGLHESSNGGLVPGTQEAWKGERGAVQMPDGRIVIGKVAAPPQQEATSTSYHFWVPRDVLVEKTQLVTCESQVAGQTYTFYGIVEEVHRQSRKRNMSNEIDEFDEDLSHDPPFASDGITFAEVSILRTEPPVFAPPRERSNVFLAGPEEARMAYAADEIEHPLAVGLIKNGGSHFAGPGYIDLNYLLGANGGHMNVNGVAGRGTKSSFLLFTINMLLYEARKRQRARPSDPDPLMIVPIILNVKGYDLFSIDRLNASFDPERHKADWEALGVEDPAPFRNVAFYAPQMPGGNVAVPVGRDDVKPYSWSLSDVVERGLLLYLFADEDSNDANFGALALDIEAWLTAEKDLGDGNIQRRLRTGDTEEEYPTTFDQLLTWISAQARLKDDKRILGGHHTGTWAKLRRRLLKLVLEGSGTLRRHDKKGYPLDVAARQTRDPIVVDLNAISGAPALQRFVVATIFRQLIDERTGPSATNGLRYLVALDELNRFAPRGSHDPITELVENVAAEKRSQGIILLGAQQQASKVSEKVIENSGIRVLGHSGALELSQPVWRFLSDGARRKAESLGIEEKLIIQDNFREPMHVRVPFPTWAMRPGEAARTSPEGENSVDTTRRRRPTEDIATC